MANKVLNIKACSPIKLLSGLIGKSPQSAIILILTVSKLEKHHNLKNKKWQEFQYQ